MKTVRIICLHLLAIIYFGGTFAQISGAAFPLIGPGQKTLGDFSGKARMPVAPIISPRRHLPMVKIVTLSPALPVNRQEFVRSDQVVCPPTPDKIPPLLSTPRYICGTRAPPTP